MLKRFINKIIEIYYLGFKKDYIAYARKLGVNIGEKCNILCNPRLVFGSEPWLIKIGNHVEITQGVRFVNHEGAVWCIRGLDKKFDNLDKFAPITIGDNVMIGMNSLIMPGVTIGNNVVIGAHSVVTRDILDGSIVAGVPARYISTLESFKNRMIGDCVPTRKMSQEEKRKYLIDHHPEWF